MFCIVLVLCVRLGGIGLVSCRMCGFLKILCDDIGISMCRYNLLFLFLIVLIVCEWCVCLSWVWLGKLGSKLFSLVVVFDSSWLLIENNVVDCMFFFLCKCSSVECWEFFWMLESLVVMLCVLVVRLLSSELSVDWLSCSFDLSVFLMCMLN